MDDQTNVNLASALRSVDRFVHEPVRLYVLTALLHSGQLEFTTITRNAALSDGNLSAHAAKLEKAGFVTIRKSFRKRTPTTVLRITDLGMEAIESYWATIGWILESISAARERA